MFLTMCFFFNSNQRFVVRSHKCPMAQLNVELYNALIEVRRSHKSGVYSDAKSRKDEAGDMNLTYFSAFICGALYS